MNIESAAEGPISAQKQMLLLIDDAVTGKTHEILKLSFSRDLIHCYSVFSIITFPRSETLSASAACLPSRM